MAGLNIGEVRDALAKQLTDRFVSRHTNVSVRGEERPAPCIWISILPGDSSAVDPWVTSGGRGVATVKFLLEVDPGGPNDEEATRRLDAYLSVGSAEQLSVIDAVERDLTLGGKVGDTFASFDGIRSSTGSAGIARFVVQIMLNKIDAEVG